MSAVERKPAQLVAQTLVVEHKFSDLVGELGALPPALQAASRLGLAFRRCRSRGPDRVGRGSEFVGRHMAHRRGLAGSARGMPCRPTQDSGRSVCVAGRRAGLSPRDLTQRPGTSEVDRPTWTVVLRPCLLEVVQHVLRAVSRPHREKTMIVVLEGPAATHGDEPRIPDLGEDHRFRLSDQERDLVRCGGAAEIVVECCQRPIDVHGQLEVCGVVHGQPVALRERD